MFKPTIALLCAASVIFYASYAMASYEEPEFEIVRTTDDYEIRRYEPYLVGEVTVEGSYEGARRRGFRMLAGYIFGNNSKAVKMKMTTPVTTEATSVRMNMTVPVTTAKVGKRSWVMHFVMEKRYSRDSLPKPNDKRVRIVEVPAKTVAVRRYSGFTTEANFRTNRDRLLAALERDGLAVRGKPINAVYNGPYTLPFMRRNEVLVELGGR
jgi:hypothetical protein